MINNEEIIITGYNVDEINDSTDGIVEILDNITENINKIKNKIISNTSLIKIAGMSVDLVGLKCIGCSFTGKESK